LIQDYDLQINYHLGKANKVADTLSKKPYMSSIRNQLLGELEREGIEVLTDRKD
jgi:hypothetical protein